MYGLVLQDWVTVRGATTAPLIQEETDWLVTTDYQDLMAWIDVRASTNPPIIHLETSPSIDDVLFASMNSSGYLMSFTGPLVAQLQLGVAAVPLAQFLRWRILPSVASWDATFRILVAANAPGLISPSDNSSKARPPTIDLNPLPFDPFYYDPLSGKRGLKGFLR